MSGSTATLEIVNLRICRYRNLWRVEERFENPEDGERWFHCIRYGLDREYATSRQALMAIFYRDCPTFIVKVWPPAVHRRIAIELLANILRCEAGATAIEYGLIAGGIALAIIPIVSGIGANLAITFGSISAALQLMGQ